MQLYTKRRVRVYTLPLIASLLANPMEPQLLLLQPNQPQIYCYSSTCTILCFFACNGVTTKMEDDQNGRRPKWKMNKMEDEQNGRRTKWKTNKMEDDQNGRRPKWKTTKMEDDQNGRRPKWKTTKMEDDQN